MSNIRVIKPGSGEYIESLERLHDPPQRLFALGDKLDGEQPILSVVGSRKASAYGRQAVEQLIGGLAGSGVTIASGLALGIDGMAHRGALAAGLRTVAILPSGLDTIYPASHRSLARDIVASGGTLISEYPAGTQAAKYHFPARNRLIAALADAVLIVEAAERSGSLITAEHALDVGVAVLAVPGQISSPNSAGTNRLIQLGAGLIGSADDIRSELGLDPGRPADSVVTGSPEEQAVVESLKQGPRSVHELQTGTQMTPEEVNRALTALELAGSVKNQGSNIWSL